MFNIDHELYTITFRPENMSIGKTMILSLKLFWNIMLLSLMFSMPVIICFSVSYVLDNWI